MMTHNCPVQPFDRAQAGYAEQVREWLSNPHAYFKAFGEEARAFQERHRSERLRTMTFVAPASELADVRPKCLCVDRQPIHIQSWEEAFTVVLTRLAMAQPRVFEALQRAGELDWLGCPAGGTPFAEALENGALRPQFDSWERVIARIQWLFLMAGIRLNEAIVQVDPYTDEAWKIRSEALKAKRAANRERWSAGTTFA